MDILAYVTASVLLVSAFAVVAVPFALSRATRRLRARAASPITIGVLIGAWFAAAALLAATGADRVALGGLVPVVGILFVLGLAGIALAVAALPGLRARLGEPAVRSDLVAVQVWRVEGLVFLVLLALGQLPALFAAPAGVGDAIVGFTAPLVARNLHRRGLAIAWNVFGLADLAVAVTLGATTSPGPAQLFSVTPASAAMTEFPLAIIPTFLVPLSIGLHILSLRALWSAAPQPAWTRTVSATRSPS